MQITSLNLLFKDFFKGKLRDWKMSSIATMHLLTKFTSVDRIYKINKQNRRFFSFFFNQKNNPLKDEIYELQKSISDKFGQEFKEKLLKYYYENSF